VIIIATGSELKLALEARIALAGDLDVRVVSMPCVEWFAEQDSEYRESVLPSSVTARVSVEAAISQPWWQLIGTSGRHVGIEHYGASADQATLYREFGITVEAVADGARASHSSASI
jgi:transketolase